MSKTGESVKTPPVSLSFPDRVKSISLAGPLDRERRGQRFGERVGASRPRHNDIGAKRRRPTPRPINNIARRRGKHETIVGSEPRSVAGADFQNQKRRAVEVELGRHIQARTCVGDRPVQHLAAEVDNGGLRGGTRAKRRDHRGAERSRRPNFSYPPIPMTAWRVAPAPIMTRSARL